MKVDYSAIVKNFDTVKAETEAGICAMLKADAYGHGLVPTAQALETRADFFGLARTEEALILREAGIKTPLLVVGPPDATLCRDAIRQGITMSVMGREDAACVSACARREKMPAKVHIALDTGMHRYGISDKAEFLALCTDLLQDSNLAVEGAFSHLSSVTSDPEYTKSQLAAFKNFRTAFSGFQTPPIRWHIAASSAVFLLKCAHYDMVRAGIALYGCCDAAPAAGRLYPAMTVLASVGQISDLKAGDRIGYDGAYKAKHDLRAAVVEIGYGDGYPRLVSKGAVCIEGCLCPVVGKVCMDVLVADVSRVPRISRKSTVEVLGPRVGAEGLAAAAGTICYDIFTGFTGRVERVR